jgi:hypothetical protein
MNGDIKVELKGANHPFAYYIESPIKKQENTQEVIETLILSSNTSNTLSQKKELVEELK